MEYGLHRQIYLSSAFFDSLDEVGFQQDAVPYVLNFIDSNLEY